MINQFELFNYIWHLECAQSDNVTYYRGKTIDFSISNPVASNDADAYRDMLNHMFSIVYENVYAPDAYCFKLE